MTRGERRREARAADKGRLSWHNIQRFNNNRRLPKGPPGFDTGEPILTSPTLGRQFLGVIRRSGVVHDLEHRLSRHPGKRSRVTAQAILLGLFLAAYTKDSYRRADVCSVLNGLDARIAFEVGLCDNQQRWLVSYWAVCTQIQRLEAALTETWTTPTGKIRNHEWLVRRLLAAGIPNRYLKKVKAVVLDSTPDPTWANSRDYRLEKDILAEHRLQALENPDLAEPHLDTPTATTVTAGEVGTIGPDGRAIRSADVDARPGYKSATSKQPAGLFLGYDVHFVTAAAEAEWNGKPEKINIKPAPPGFILGLSVAPASTNPGLVGLDVVEQALGIAPEINEVIPDRAYTTKRKTFVRPLHKQGMNVVMDYTSTDIDQPKTIEAGTKGQQLLVHAGTFLPPWLPEEMQTPPKNASPGELTDWYTARALWRWAPNQKHVKDGMLLSVQFGCPQCAGRVLTNAETRLPKPVNTTPPYRRVDAKCCCKSNASVPLAELDSHQKHPYGTLAWKASYARRNRSENTNSMIKDKGGLKDGWCRAFGLASHTLGALALAVAYNLRLGRRHITPRKLFRPTHEDLTRLGLRPRSTHTPTTTAPTPTRAPP